MKQDGFTLIELMIVVVIIGILAAIAIPNFMSMQRKAKEAAVSSNIYTLALTATNFATQAEGFFPANPGVNTVGQILTILQNQPVLNATRIADACPADNAQVNDGTNLDPVTKTNLTLIPGNRTYFNPFAPSAIVLDIGPVVPLPMPANWKGIYGLPDQGTVVWHSINAGLPGPLVGIGAKGYAICGGGYRDWLTVTHVFPD